MAARIRSPFGAVLREERRTQRISQAELANRIAERFASDPSVAALGVVSDRAIANIEAAKGSANEFVRPRAETVQVLMLALNIDPDSDRGHAMLGAADATRRSKLGKDVPAESPDVLPFVRSGREGQWMALVRAWELARGGQPQVRMVTGGAGTGKTSLIREFTSHVLSDDPVATIGWGECAIGATDTEPYLPFREAVSSILKDGITDAEITEFDEMYAVMLLESLRKLGGVVIDLRILKTFLASRSPQHLADMERARETLVATDTVGRFDQAVSLISQAASISPLIIVLEDLQWADVSSCSLLLFLQRQMRHHTDLPLLVIGSYRSGDLALHTERNPLQQTLNELGRHVDNFKIDLDKSIGQRPGQEFVRELTKSFVMGNADRERLVDTLFQRTDGHPLYTTELIQLLIANGALCQRSDQTWTLRDSKLDQVLPEKMRAVLAERIGRLPDAARDMLEAASVQGVNFIADVLGAVAQIDDARADVIIDRELSARHHLIRAMEGDDRANHYEFDHHATAEYVYQSLSQRRRRALHKRTAEALVAFFADDPYAAAPLAAWHYEQATELNEAVRQAISSSYAALVKLDYDLTLVWVDRTERLAIAAADTKSLWEARLRRAQALRGLGKLEEAERFSREALNHAQQIAEPGLEAQALDMLSLISYDQGRMTEAITTFTRSSELYLELGRMDRVSANRSMLSHCNTRIGMIDLAITHARDAWEVAPNNRRNGFGAESQLAHGNAYLEIGAYSRALEYFSSAQHIFDHIGEVRGMLLASMNIGFCMARLGLIEMAQEKLTKLRDEAEQIRTPRLIAYTSYYLGMVHELAGDYEKAQQAYRQSLTTRRKFGQEGMIGTELAGLLRVAVATDSRIETRLHALQQWWRSHDPTSLDDPLLVLQSFAEAYKSLGDKRLLDSTLSEGVQLFVKRARMITDDELRATYWSEHPSGNTLLLMNEEAGLGKPELQ